MIKIYTLYDKKSANHFTVMTFINSEVAKRELRGMFIKKDNMLSVFPEDYDLYEIGEFDEKTAVITPLNNYICNLMEIKMEVENAVRKQKRLAEEDSE